MIWIFANVKFRGEYIADNRKDSTHWTKHVWNVVFILFNNQ